LKPMPFTGFRAVLHGSSRYSTAAMNQNIRSSRQKIKTSGTRL
jgi:hypothetical protein